jgi:hypothetical protein
MRPVVAAVTGFTKNRTLLQRSFAPLVRLLRDGVIQRILYVTWDSAAIDQHVETARGLPEVELVRIPEPCVSGGILERGFAYQIYNLQAALGQITELDALVVKLRPDFVFQEVFLREKITHFDKLCAPSRLAELFNITALPSPFAAKLWVPWAVANMPFHIEDAAFIGLKADVAKLADADAVALVKELNLPEQGYGSCVHVARYATPFISSYPLFAHYLRNYRYFWNDRHYRPAMMAVAAEHRFFWRMVVANAWILASCFHVDCGGDGQISFYPNHCNRMADWNVFETLRIHSPYDAIEEWRQAQQPGAFLPTAGRIHARLVDDAWQQALFCNDALSDITPKDLRNALQAAFNYRPPDSGEVALYDAMEECHRSFQHGNSPAAAVAI